MQHRGWEKIENWSIWYAIPKVYVNFFHNRVYYKRVIALNRQNIPRDVPVIFAPNHQNALLDPLAILCTFRGQPVFLARSDVFKKKYIARILYYLKMLPVYRIRDGISNVSKNDRVFRKTIDVIRKKRGLVILPEGNHSDSKRLRILKKGIARIAFQAEEDNNFSLGIHIVPVGLDFRDYKKFRSTLLVSYGEPIPVAKFVEQYYQQPQKAMAALLNELSDKLKEQMIHIENEQFYELYMRLADIYSGNSEYATAGIHSHKGRFFREKRFFERLDKLLLHSKAKMKMLEEMTGLYSQRIRELGLRDWLVSKRSVSPTVTILMSIGLLVTLPVFITGLVLNFLPFFIADRLAVRVKDPMFRPSFNFVISLLLYPVYGLILFTLFLFLTTNVTAILLFLAAIPVSGVLAYRHAEITGRVFLRMRYHFVLFTRREYFTRLKEVHSSIIAFLDKHLYLPDK